MRLSARSDGRKGLAIASIRTVSLSLSRVDSGGGSPTSALHVPPRGPRGPPFPPRDSPPIEPRGAPFRTRGDAPFDRGTANGPRGPCVGFEGGKGERCSDASSSTTRRNVDRELARWRLTRASRALAGRRGDGKEARDREDVPRELHPPPRTPCDARCE